MFICDTHGTTMELEDYLDYLQSVSDIDDLEDRSKALSEYLERLDQQQ